MNTYRVYALNVVAPLEPRVVIAYIQAEKYDGAWKGARAQLNGHHTAPKLYEDPACKKEHGFMAGDHITCVRIDDIRPRNVKLDKKALQEILSDPKASATEKLAAMKAIVG